MAAILFINCILTPGQWNFIVRADNIIVRSNDSSDNMLELGECNIHNNTQLGLTFGYMITYHINVELLAATLFGHYIELKQYGSITNGKQLPLVLMAQYCFGDTKDKLRPYISIGVNIPPFMIPISIKMA